MLKRVDADSSARPPKGNHKAKDNRCDTSHQPSGQKDSAHPPVNGVVVAAEPVGKLQVGANYVEQARQDVHVGQPWVAYETRMVLVVRHGPGYQAGYVDQQTPHGEAQDD
jgi:hypothetical protein